MSLQGETEEEGLHDEEGAGIDDVHAACEDMRCV